MVTHWIVLLVQRRFRDRRICNNALISRSINPNSEHSNLVPQSNDHRYSDSKRIKFTAKARRFHRVLFLREPYCRRLVNKYYKTCMWTISYLVYNHDLHHTNRLFPLIFRVTMAYYVVWRYDFLSIRVEITPVIVVPLYCILKYKPFIIKHNWKGWVIF